MMQKYADHDIIMSDDENKCPLRDIYGYHEKNRRYNHDTVIVGVGSVSIYQYWLVKQSWGSKFGHSGYMKIQVTENNDDAPFCT